MRLHDFHERLKLVRGNRDHRVIVKGLSAIGYIDAPKMFEAVIDLNLSVRPVESGNISCTSWRWRGLGGKPFFSIDLVLSKNLRPVLPCTHSAPVRQLNNLVRAPKRTGVSSWIS